MKPAWPKLEVAGIDKQITVSAEIQGMEEKDIKHLFDDGNLAVRGEMKSGQEDKERQFSERFYSRFERRIPARMDINESKIEASFQNGVLKVALPKTKWTKSKAKRIAINTPAKH